MTPTLQDLEQRIAALENRPPADQLSNNLTTYVNGRIGAAFTGLVNAQGLILPAGNLAGTPPLENQVTWETVAGAEVATLWAYSTGQAGGENLFMKAQAMPGDASQVEIYAADDQGSKQAALAVTQLQRGSGTVVATAGPNSVRIIDNAAASSFLQLSTADNASLQLGLVSWSTPGGAWFGIPWSFPKAFTTTAYCVYGMYYTSGINNANYHELASVTTAAAQVNAYSTVAAAGYVYFMVIGK